MSARRSTAATLLTLAVATAALAGCSQKKDDKAGSDAVKVNATDTACEVSKTTFPAGHIVLDIANKGSKTTEVYVYAAGDKIVTERENIGPGTKATVNAEIKAGSYEIACKPGMVGDGIRQKITVTGEGSAAAVDPRLTAAVDAYRAYAQEQADATVPAVEAFAAAIKGGDLERAKSLYAPSRTGWERTEPVAESFGDVDPKTDTREDGLEPGQEWTGWHKLEKSLWVDAAVGDAEKKLADQLVADLKDWQKRIPEAEITATGMANGAKELLDEVATGKVTGEEDRYSHTDLADFAANVEGAKKAYELLKPVAAEKDAALAKTLDSEFAALEALLAKYKQADGSYTSYEKVTEAERKTFSDAVNALGEPLSKLAAAVVAE
ncbi:peptidase M75 family protein [Streptomyces sp. BE20]|uniref:iron uptake system protein EfeO n=1 Tax=unclassified Streptomyces TaxID=2593676 RepID=UPI002E7974CA|nr:MULTISPECIES: iron uptake system protein EfeO [unclassified Streptomyces]MED7949280.1 peptidase M75 family protein [Streptomyces sp. BE303]MEE1826285.1 peptidase M75 family protein [Streptomyces sp. BE20]